MTNTASAAIPPLDDLGAVSPEYSHGPKRIQPGRGLALRDAYLKWYDIARPDTPVPAEIHALAREHLLAEARAGKLAISGQLGFVILHRCGEAFYFLIACTWRNDNELWETVYAKDGAAQRSFSLFQVAATHRPTFCVWELGAVWHEQQAWSRFLATHRDAPAKASYLEDSYEGVV